jgi:hypothetical protein
MAEKDTVEDLKAIALKALRQVAEDAESPAAARAQASRTLLEAIGVLGRGADALADRDRQDLTTMTRAELDAEIRRLSGVESVIPADSTNVTRLKKPTKPKT